MMKTKKLNSVTKTRRNFTFVTMVILSIVVLIVSGVIMVSCYSQEVAERDQLLTSLMDHEKKRDDNPPPASDSSTSLSTISYKYDADKFDKFRSFVARFDESNQLLSIDVNAEIYDVSEVTTYAQDAYNSSVTSGKVGFFHFLRDENILVGIDRVIEEDRLQQIMIVVVCSSLGGLALLALIVWRLGFYIVKPIEDSNRKQAEFISNASHELKTPISIISASVTALEDEIGPNKWSESIQEQALRMKGLSQDMLSLSKSEEQREKVVFTNFNCSQITEFSCMSFESLAFESKKEFKIDIKNNLQAFGEANIYKKIVEILVENAMKYADKFVEVTLTEEKNHLILNVINDGSEIDE